MDFWNLAIRIIFLIQATTGILGNFSLMVYYLVLYYRERKLKPRDLILMHLTTANALIILCAGVPHTMVVWGMKQFLNDFRCELLLYIQSFGRSMCIGTTCLLSVFQAMIISPRKSCWKDHKVNTAKYIDFSITILLIFYMLIHFIFFMKQFIKMKSMNITRNRDFGYCSAVGHDEIDNSLYAVLVICPEFFFSVLITWSGTSMIVILCRHKQKIQHIRSHHGSNRKSPESRATQNILVLVSTFLAFYCLSCILRNCIALLHNLSRWLVYITRFISLSFSSFGPFILMSHYSFASRLSLAWLRKRFS